MLSKIFHAHGRALDMPSGISNSPRTWPCHGLVLELAVSKPENEILRIPLSTVDLYPCPFLKLIKIEAGKFSIVIYSVNGEIDITIRGICVPPSLKLLDDLNHLVYMVGCLADYNRLLYVELRDVRHEGIGIEGCNIPYALALLFCTLGHLVLAVIPISCKVSDVGYVHDVLDSVAIFLKHLSQYVFKNIGSEIADMSVVVNGRSAAVHADLPLLYALKRFHSAAHRIIYSHKFSFAICIKSVLCLIMFITLCMTI